MIVRNEIGNVLETYNIRKLEPYRGPAVYPRSRIVHQGEGQSDYFFIHQQIIKEVSSYLFERSIAGGEECSRPRDIHWSPSILQ